MRSIALQESIQQTMPTVNFRPADIAKECNVSVNTIRKWCQDYEEFLSPGARVTGEQRILTEDDLEVFKYISQLRKEKLPKPQIILRIRETPLGTVEPAQASIQPSNPIQESPQATETGLMIVDALQSIIAPLAAHNEALESRLQTLERQRQKIDVAYLVVITFALGLLVGLSIWWFK